MSTEFNVEQSVVDAAAASCARKLAKWFGSEQEAIEALLDDPVGMAQIAMGAHIKERRSMTLAAHMNPRAVSRQVLELIKQGATPASA